MLMRKKCKQRFAYRQVQGVSPRGLIILSFNIFSDGGFRKLCLPLQVLAGVVVLVFPIAIVFSLVPPSKTRNL